MTKLNTELSLKQLQASLMIANREAQHWQDRWSSESIKLGAAYEELRGLKNVLDQAVERIKFWQQEAARLGWRGTLDETK